MFAEPDEIGNLYVMFQEYLNTTFLKLSPSGTIVWITSFKVDRLINWGNMCDMTILENGNIVGIGFIEEFAFIATLSASGTIIRTKAFSYNNETQFYNIHSDDDDYIYVNGFAKLSSGDYGTVLLKLDSTSNTIWSIKPDTISPFNNPRKIGVDTDGHIFLLGSTVNAKPGFAEYDEMGQLIGSYELGSGLVNSRSFNLSASGYEILLSYVDQPPGQNQNIGVYAKMSIYNRLLCQLNPLTADSVDYISPNENLIGVTPSISDLNLSSNAVTLTPLLITTPEVCATTSTKKEAKTSSVKVGPNPADQNVYISIDALEGSFTCYLYDLTGQIRYQSMHNTQEGSYLCVPVSSLPNGFYVLKVHQKQQPIHTQKIIVQHE